MGSGGMDRYPLWKLCRDTQAGVSLRFARSAVRHRKADRAIRNESLTFGTLHRAVKLHAYAIIVLNVISGAYISQYYELYSKGVLYLPRWQRLSHDFVTLQHDCDQ